MHWFEDERMWETFFPVLFGEDRLGSVDRDVERILELSGVREGAALDLCCGPGRHSKALADHGLEVTAVDRSPFLLGKAREHCAGSPIEFVEADMRSFVRPFHFDLILNLFTSFGYFEKTEEDLAVLKCIKASLKPGGVTILDLASKEGVAQSRQPTRWRELADGRVFVEHTRVLANWARVHNTWLLVSADGKTERFDFELNIYSGIEMVALLANAGFTDVELFGNLDGDPYDEHAGRLIVRARA